MLRRLAPASTRAVGRASAQALALTAAAIAASACAAGYGTATGGAAGGGAPGGGGSLREERVVVGEYATIEAVAAGRRFVFVAAAGGLAAYDRLLAAWLPPVAATRSGLDDRPTAIAADPVEDAVWIGVPGGVLVWRPTVDQVQRTIIVGVPDLIAFDRGMGGDALVRAAGQWTRVSRAGLATPLVGRAPAASSLVLPATLDDVYRRFPGLRSQLLLLLRDTAPGRPMRAAPATAGTLSPDRASEAWIGTATDGLWRVDPTFQQAEPLRFGLADRGVGALARAADGVWAAGLGQSPRGGLTLASDDLQRWRWVEGTVAVPLAGVTARALAVRAGRAWVGAEQGLYHVALDAAVDPELGVTRWSTLDGLPSERVFAVAARDDGAWAGTARGLAFVAEGGDARGRPGRGRQPLDTLPRRVSRLVLENVPVRALQPVGDTLWIGSDAGLLALPGPEAELARPLGDDPALRRPVLALAWSDSVLVAATDDALLSLAPRGGRPAGRWPGVDPRQVGQVTRLALDARALVMAGTEGVLVVERAGGGQRLLRVGPDLPAPALDVLATPAWLWIATPDGLVRWRRTGDGGVR